uniref:Tim44 domain-containing protein n=1 Tax=Desulfobacca acetoxidans TaxID=60893 RepID=A0A7C3UZQ8_9BACT
MPARKTRLSKGISIVLLLMLLSWTIPAEVLARAGRGLSGGGSFGSRGSRSTTPVRPYTPPSSPGIQPTTPTRPTPTLTPRAGAPAPPLQTPTGGFWRNFGGGILGGLAGGMLAHWLFGGAPAQAAPQGTGGLGGFGLLDLILVAGIAYLAYRLFIRRPSEQTAGVPGSYQSSLPAGSALQPPYSDQQGLPPAAEEWDLEKGLKQIQAMDPLFSEDRFKDQVMDYFFKIQGAWVDRDLNTVKHLLTGEMFRLLQDDAEKMRREGQINKLDNMAVREVNVTEAWQESGQDYVTVRIYATLLDYTVDENTGAIISGSKTEPSKFEEYWTFTRPSGNHPWQLSAISQADG